jgi:hypothetical protein
VEGGRDGKQQSPLGAARLGDLDGACHGRAGSGDDHLAAAVVVRRLASLALGGIARHGVGRLEIEAQQRCHRAHPDRHGTLHGVAADTQQTRRVGERKCARGGQRRIFAERMTRHEGHVAAEIEACLRFEDANRREADRHQRGLRIGRQRKLRLRSLEHETRKALTERIVDLIENQAGC